MRIPEDLIDHGVRRARNNKMKLRALSRNVPDAAKLARERLRDFSQVLELINDERHRACFGDRRDHAEELRQILNDRDLHVELLSQYAAVLLCQHRFRHNGASQVNPRHLAGRLPPEMLANQMRLADAPAAADQRKLSRSLGRSLANTVKRLELPLPAIEPEGRHN